MSVLRHASKHVASTDAYKALNAFIRPKPATGGQEGRAQSAGSNAATRTSTSNAPLAGQLIAIKDNICTAEESTTCGSAQLGNFQSPAAATVVTKLQDAGAVIAGKTNLDEFGMGSNSIFSQFGSVKNALNAELSAGGSSGGSAVAVRSEQCYAALGTDTGGSVRLPAAYNSVVGFKPSYGLVSRWGVVAYANSLDTVGVLASNVSRARIVFAVIRGHDPRDPTSLSTQSRSRIYDALATQKSDSSRLRIGVPREYITHELQTPVRAAWAKSLGLLQQAGHQLLPVSLPTTKAALSAYYVLAPAEASSNLARFDGVRYGSRSLEPRPTGDVLYSNTRGDKLGDEVRRRILLGAFTLSATAKDNYFVQAQRIRRLVQHDFNRVFALRHPLLDHSLQEQGQDEEQGKIDMILVPTAATRPPRLDALQEQRNLTKSYSADLLTVPASLAGLPAINIPVDPSLQAAPDTVAENGGIGMQVIGQFGADEAVLEAAQTLEDLLSISDS